MNLGPTDPKQILEFLVGNKTEPYPYARVIALLTFRVWMTWPNDQDMVRNAQIMAAASVVVYERQKKRRIKLPLTIEMLCQELTHRPINGTYYEAMEPSIEPISDLVGFFMHCPEQLKPSLLKARYFIDAGGFVPDGISEKEQKEYKKSETTLKAVWREHAQSGPFVWAAYGFEDSFDLLDLVPDEIESIETSKRFLASPRRLRTFLELALYCQTKLQRVLDPAAARFEFVKFPKSIELLDWDISTFDDVQLAIMNEYSTYLGKFDRPRQTKKT